MPTKPLDEMSEDDVLAFCGGRAEAIREAEADLLRGAYQWAVIHPADRLDPEEAAKPGREQARQYGGEATPMVCEFAAAELGARVGMTTYAAGMLMADALDLVHRAPVLWARVEAGEVKASYARFVVKQTRHLPADQARRVAAAVAPSADGRLPWTRFEALVEATVAKADPDAAREREEHARKATFARKLRTEADGMASFLIRAPLPVIEQIAATHRAYSDALKNDFPELDDDERDVQAIVMLLTPGSDADLNKLVDVLPTANLYVHTYLGADRAGGTGMARIEGHGMVTEDYLRDVLGPRCRFKVYPVIDIEGMAPVDAYEIPDRHRRAVHLMTPADTFPWGSSTSRAQQIDHTVPYDQGGASSLGNYGPMTITHHRIKTHGGWEVEQPFPGIYLWRDQYGATYLVDNTGTRALGKATPAPVVVEIHRQMPRLELDQDAA
jgi:hypothetical protein